MTTRHLLYSYVCTELVGSVYYGIPPAVFFIFSASNLQPNNTNILQHNKPLCFKLGNTLAFAHHWLKTYTVETHQPIQPQRTLHKEPAFSFYGILYAL